MKNRNLRSVFVLLFCCWFAMLSVLSGCGQTVHSNEVASSEADFDDDDSLNEVKKLVIAGWFKEDCTTNLMAYLAETFPEYEFEYRYISKRSYESLIDAQLPSRLAPDIVMVTQNMARKHGEELQKVLLGERSMQIAFEVIDDKVSIILGEE